MAKSVRITFSKPHGEKDDEHFDTYRRSSDSSKTEKIDHTPVEKEREVRINKDKD